MHGEAIRWPQVTTELAGREAELCGGDETPPLNAELLPFLNELDEERRLVIEAQYGMNAFERPNSMAEIAAQFGWSRATVYRRRHEAIEITQSTL